MPTDSPTTTTRAAFEAAVELCEQLHFRAMIYANKGQHDAWVAAHLGLMALYDQAAQAPAAAADGVEGVVMETDGGSLSWRMVHVPLASFPIGSRVRIQRLPEEGEGWER